MYRDIGVTLDPRPSTEPRITAAAALARAHGARLIGLDLTAEGDARGRWRSRAAHVREAFEDCAAGTGVPGRYRKVAMGDLLPMNQLHCVDLVVTGPDVMYGEDEGGRSGSIEHAVLGAGVPVLCLPAEWRLPSIPSFSVVLAWNGGREATRAVHDALPLLRHAGNVVVFACSAEGGSPAVDQADILIGHLARHGIDARSYTWSDLGDDSPVELLFECLTAQDADLVVAGAYGHPRWMRSLFKGTTDALLRHPRIPTLLSH